LIGAGALVDVHSSLGWVEKVVLWALGIVGVSMVISAFKAYDDQQNGNYSLTILDDSDRPDL